MISAFVLSLAISTTSVPPGAPVENHAHPAHFAQPTIRVFARRAVDSSRELAWITYSHELDQLWLAYRAAGGTPAAWRQYVDAAGEAKRRYVYGDPYLAPIVDDFVW
jgi:hypothetical protein